jgi:hypothetical protein
MMCIYSDVAIDYKKGLDIYDSVTKRIYSDEEAHMLPKKVKSRLTMRPRKIGTWVKTLEELGE